MAENLAAINLPRIRLLILDVDGVLTDGRMSLADDGKVKTTLTSLLSQAQRAGLADKLVASLMGKDGPKAAK